MSLLPADEIGYLDYVAEFFLAQKGAGTGLSPLDVDLVRRYEGEGVPFEVVCRGVERAFEVRRRNGKERTPHLSLRACKRSIEAEVRRFRAGAVRGSGPVPAPAVLDLLLANAREAAGSPASAGWRAAYRALCMGEDPRPAAAAAYLAALPGHERRDLFRAARPARSGATRLARREAFRAALTTAALEHGKLDLS